MADIQQSRCYRRMAVGAVIFEELGGGRILLVYNKRQSGGGHWSLPKGSCEEGEPLIETLRREVKEETGLVVEPVELAFVTEFFVPSRKEWYLQHYFHAQAVGGVVGVQPRDPDVTAVRWVQPDEVDHWITFRPWQQPVDDWLRERRPRYHVFR